MKVVTGIYDVLKINDTAVKIGVHAVPLTFWKFILNQKTLQYMLFVISNDPFSHDKFSKNSLCRGPKRGFTERSPGYADFDYKFDCNRFYTWDDTKNGRIYCCYMNTVIAKKINFPKNIDPSKLNGVIGLIMSPKQQNKKNKPAADLKSPPASEGKQNTPVANLVPFPAPAIPQQSSQPTGTMISFGPTEEAYDYDEYYSYDDESSPSDDDDDISILMDLFDEPQPTFLFNSNPIGESCLDQVKEFENFLTGNTKKKISSFKIENWPPEKREEASSSDGQHYVANDDDELPGDEADSAGHSVASGSTNETVEMEKLPAKKRITREFENQQAKIGEGSNSNPGDLEERPERDEDNEAKEHKEKGE